MQSNFYSPFYYYEQLAPLSIVPITTTTKGNSSSWSPFSTPSFSPYEYSRSNQTFQYSNLFLSPNSLNSTNSVTSPISRPILQNAHQNQIGSPLSIRKIGHKENNDAPGLYSPNQFKSSFDQSPNTRQMPKRSENVDLSDYIRQAALQRAVGGRLKMCTFCRTNGESKEVYTSHSLKDSNDKITCPILMCYSCPVCGASGEKTHTKKYCPVLQKRLRMDMLNKHQKVSANNQ